MSCGIIQLLGPDAAKNDDAQLAVNFTHRTAHGGAEDADVSAGRY